MFSDALDIDSDADALMAPDAIAVQQHIIGRTRLSDLYSEKREKQYRPVYTKGRILSNYIVAPFGFRKGGEAGANSTNEQFDDPVDADQPCCSHNIF